MTGKAASLEQPAVRKARKDEQERLSSSQESAISKPFFLFLFFSRLLTSLTASQRRSSFTIVVLLSLPSSSRLFYTSARRSVIARNGLSKPLLRFLPYFAACYCQLLVTGNDSLADSYSHVSVRLFPSFASTNLINQRLREIKQLFVRGVRERERSSKALKAVYRSALSSGQAVRGRQHSSAEALPEAMGECSKGGFGTRGGYLAMGRQ
jgi:hypothetical protein